MTKTQKLMTEMQAMVSTDLLSDLLGNMHLSGMILFRAEFREPWGLIAPAACHLSQILPFHTEHIIPFHIIAENGCWLELEGHERVWLEAGDAILLPYGDLHILCGRDDAEKLPAIQLLPAPPWPDMLAVEHGGTGKRTRVICGFLHCDELLFNPMLGNLPKLMHVSPTRSETDAWLASTILHTAHEASRAYPGSRSMLSRLTELMFMEILRRHMQNLSIDEVGWFAAANDAVVGSALKLLHAAPSEKWNVDMLAHQVGVSRTILAERFNHFLNMPPMHYLTNWRLQLAAKELKTTRTPLKGIVETVGYESEAAFSRAFKRYFGLAPSDWRKKQMLGKSQ